MLIELDHKATVTRPDGTLRIYAPGQPIWLSPAEIASIVIQTDLAIRVVSIQRADRGCRAVWKTDVGTEESGLILQEFKYGGKEPMLLVLQDGKGLFVKNIDVRFDPSPLICAAREAGRAALADRGPVMAENLIRHLLELLEDDAP